MKVSSIAASLTVIFSTGLILTHKAFPAARTGLTITDLGKIGPGLSARDEQRGTKKKWAKVREVLGSDAERVIIKQLANRNNASSPRAPVINDAEDTYPGGWGLRREGNGKIPPLRVPGEKPPTDPATLRQLQTESAFPSGHARYTISPTCEGYPDVDTYRDLEFYIIEHKQDLPH